MTKKLIIEPITRIEGHAKITIDVDDADEIIEGNLQVLEIRGFEKFVEHMELFKMPLITARICGVCPAAHHLAAVKAIENGCKKTIPKEAQYLRELLYMGHILHSHALSCFVLLGPDILTGLDAKAQERNIFHLLSSNPDLAKKALKLRSIGQRIVEIIGGRGVHPVTSIPGGITVRPTADEMKNIVQWGEEALVLLEDLYPFVVQMLGKLNAIRAAAHIEGFPLALSNNGMVNFLEGNCTVVDTNGNVERSFSAATYAEHLIERVMPASYMKAVRLRGGEGKNFFVGPLARCHVNGSFSTPKATALLKNFNAPGAKRFSILDNIEARLIEMVHCAERIIEIAAQPPGNENLSIQIKPAAGRYIGVVEAPRGILIHDYTADENGQVTSANLIVATQNNYHAINAAITSLAKYFKPTSNDSVFMNGIEFAVRCFDPCLSCATHAVGRMPMVIEIQRSGNVIRTISRG